MGEFYGEWMYLYSYIDLVEFFDCIDKSIVIVGMGNFGLEIVCEFGLKGVVKLVYVFS